MTSTRRVFSTLMTSQSLFLKIFLVLCVIVCLTTLRLDYSAKEQRRGTVWLPQYQFGDVGSTEDDSIGNRYKEPSSDELTADLELGLPNVPFAYMHRHRNRTMQKSQNCAMLAPPYELRYYNTYWQTFDLKNITFQLYGAYYDTRDDVPQGPVIRILALVNQIKAPFPKAFCHIWYENVTTPDVVAITEYKSIWRFGGSHMFFPYFITCQPPKASNGTQGERIPQAVSMVEQYCDTPKNLLKVVYEKLPASEEKRPFAICVKGLDFPYADISYRLTEWLEMQRLLGAHKIFMYEIALHPNVKTVLNHYQNEGFVEVLPITLVGGVVGLPHMQHWLLRSTLLNKRLNELVPYNDCFYRHMYKYDYIALLDVDEVIMPLGELTTWQALVEVSAALAKRSNCKNGSASLCFRNTYVPFDASNFTMSSADNSSLEVTPAPAPSHMFMLNRPMRTSNYSRLGYATKCLHRTTKVSLLHNHLPVEWMNSCRPFYVPESVGHLQHYHDFEPGNEFNGLVPEYSVERFRQPLIEKTTKVLQEIGLLK